MRKSRFVVCSVLLLNMFLTAQQNYMNSVERGMWDSYKGRATIFICSPDTVVQYSQGDLIPQEAPHEIADTKPGVTWPEHGSIEFNNITMSYRPGLPKVLKGISMSIKGGEKIGVVGRLGFFLLRRKWHSTVTPGPELERVRSCWHYSGSSNWTQGASQLTGQCKNTWAKNERGWRVQIKIEHRKAHFANVSLPFLLARYFPPMRATLLPRSIYLTIHVL